MSLSERSGSSSQHVSMVPRVQSTLPHVAGVLPRIAVVLTSFNRKDFTRRIIYSIKSQTFAECIEEIVLVDDNSSDGTQECVKLEFPDVKLIAGTGDLYWTGGMRMGMDAVNSDDIDYFWLLNDDGEISGSALESLVGAFGQVDNPNSIICGAFTDSPSSSDVTYGGIIQVGAVTFNTKRAPIARHVTPVDTFNGNCVLVPREVVHAVGGLSDRFTHHYGDWDFGLRAQALGIRTFVAPGVVGYVSRNSDLGTHSDASASVRTKLSRLRQPKGLPITEHWVFMSRHSPIGGMQAGIGIAATIVRTVAAALVSPVARLGQPGRIAVWVNKTSTIRIDAVDLGALVARITDPVERDGSSGIVVTPNLHHLVTLRRDKRLRAVYGRARVVVADGWPVAAIATLRSKRRVARVCGSDLLPAILARGGSGATLWIIGGSSELSLSRVAERGGAAGWKVLSDVATASDLASSTYRSALIRQVASSTGTGDVVVLGLGSPKQENFAHDLLEAGCEAWILCVGAALDFEAGDVPRAPKYVRHVGLEWMYRLAVEPSRMWKRYAHDLLWLPWILVINVFRVQGRYTLQRDRG